MEKEEIENKVDIIYELIQRKRILQLQEIAKELGDIYDELKQFSLIEEVLSKNER